MNRAICFVAVPPDARITSIGWRAEVICIPVWVPVIAPPTPTLPVRVLIPDTANVPVTLESRAREIAPVPVLLRERVPEPLAFIVPFSFVPDDITARFAPAAAAAPVNSQPVATDAVAALTFKTGSVAPCRPTAKDAALAAVTRRPATVQSPNVTEPFLERNECEVARDVFELSPRK